MVNISLLIILLTYSVAVFNVRAKPPDIVWRVDTRSHEEIFNNGFYSSGTNNNIIEHLSGRSCRNAGNEHGGSAFISTTADRRFAHEYAERILRHREARGEPNIVINVYQIRATHNMYSAHQTLDFFLSHQGQQTHPEVLRVIRFSSHLSEWMALLRIGPNQISSVTQYYLHGGSIHSDAPLYNPRFRQTRSSASSRPYDTVYTVIPVLRLARIWMMRTGISPMIRACFGSDMERSEFKRDLTLNKIKAKGMFKLIILL
ncbi:putative AB5 enterotoxin ADP-ribosylating subunit YtxA [Yersinia sp. LJYL362]|uniref:putative AB5 enterotoxin ADP-ribosylating subunit YtxA n=1 Tax=Yersinia sp. LJYL362 TaxID=3402108 RepID=UPI003AB42875